MKLQPNPILETLLLLTNGNKGKGTKRKIIKQLNDFGINGAAFYAANYLVVERYCEAFATKRVKTGEELLESMSDEFAILVLVILILHPEWAEDFVGVSHEEAATAVSDAMASLYESSEETIEILAASELSDQAKWQIAALLQQPKKKLTLVIEAINTNIAAYEYAYTKLEPEIRPLLERLEDQIKKDQLPPSVSQVLTLVPNAQITPLLAEPLILVAFERYCCVGLLLNKMSAGLDESLTETEAFLIAKALGDASKLEILRLLNNNKLYSLEIAQQLGLTQATTSHHMNILLAAGLVEVSKDGAKVYYCLCTNGIKRYCDWLNDSFL